MSLTRFFISPDSVALSNSFWLHDQELVKRINEKLKEGDELILFDGVGEDRLYKLARIEPDGIQLQMVTELERKLPIKHIYLFWPLTSPEVNDHILTEFTKLGVSNFVPIKIQNSDYTEFNIEKAKQSVIKAAELAGWSAVPHIREHLSLEEMAKEYKDKINNSSKVDSAYIIISPANGWSGQETAILEEISADAIIINSTLTAIEEAKEAVVKLLQ